MSSTPRARPRRWPWVLAAVAVVLVGLWLALRVPDMPVAELRAKYTTPASRFMDAEPGLSVHYRDEGPAGALPIMLLHGSNASLQTWEPWVARLKARYRVITFDFPGHGLTGPSPTRGYSTAAYVKLASEVADQLKLGKFVIGGNSMGGGVAVAWAAEHPDRVLGLVLVDASGAPYKRAEAKLPIGFRIARTPVIRNLAEQITPRRLIATSLEQTFRDPKRVTPAMVDRYWELLRYPGNRAATIDRFSEPYTSVDEAALRRLTAPAVIIWGNADRLIPVDNAGWFSTHLPNARVTILDRVGHVPMEEAPDRALAPVLLMLAELAPQTTAVPRPAR